MGYLNSGVLKKIGWSNHLSVHLIIQAHNVLTNSYFEPTSIVLILSSPPGRLVTDDAGPSRTQELAAIIKF